MPCFVLSTGLHKKLVKLNVKHSCLRISHSFLWEGKWREVSRRGREEKGVGGWSPTKGQMGQEGDEEQG